MIMLQVKQNTKKTISQEKYQTSKIPDIKTSSCCQRWLERDGVVRGMDGKGEGVKFNDLLNHELIRIEKNNFSFSLL